MQMRYGLRDPLFYLSYYLWLETWMQHETLAEHEYRVSKRATDIAKKAGFTEFEVTVTCYAGLLHDIGKLGLPEERKKEHSNRGYNMILEHRGLCRLFPGREEELIAVALGVKYHHERYNGGRHYRMPIDNIPVTSFAIRIADWYDWRKYEHKWDNDKIREEMESQRGTNFHPELLSVFLSTMN